MKGQTYFILLLIFTIVISVFSVLNVSQVEVNYLFWSGKSPLIFVILASVLLGGILATILGSKKYLALHKENKAFKEQLKQLGVEVAPERTHKEKDKQ